MSPTAGVEEIVSFGFEKDRFGGDATRLDIRWWVFVWIPGHKLRSQRARMGVEDRGFTFARGGRTHSEEDAQRRIREAEAQGQRELEYWTGQPSHALSPSGELVPLDKLPPELS